MHVLIVNIQVKEDKLDEFIPAMLKNVWHSLQEPGVDRFDFYQDKEDHTKFVLVEVYKEEKNFTQHQQTAHYLEWKAKAGELLEGSLARAIYQEVPFTK